MTQVAVIVPCRNEGISIVPVLEKLSEHIPEAVICVCDNASDDDTAKKVEDFQKTHPDIILISEEKKGKANALKKAINTVDAEIYCFVDGDLTYDTVDISKFVEIMQNENIDLINIKRNAIEKNAFKHLRKLGNIFFNFIFSCLFKSKCTDILSGYKLIKKDFLKSFEFKTQGFEIEAEIHIMASKRNIKEREYSCDYHPRQENSKSKLNAFNDGFKILGFIIKSYFQK